MSTWKYNDKGELVALPPNPAQEAAWLRKSFDDRQAKISVERQILEAKKGDLGAVFVTLRITSIMRNKILRKTIGFWPTTGGSDFTDCLNYVAYLLDDKTKP